MEYLERSKEPYQDQIDVLQKQIDSYNLETEALDRQIEQHTIKKEMLEEELQTLERQNDTYDENITAIEEKYEALRKPLEEYKKLWEELGTDAEIAEAMADISNFGIEVKDVLSASEPVFTHFKDQYTGVLNDINAGNQDMLTALQAVLGDTGEGMKSYIKTMQPYLQDLKTLDLTSQNTALATAQQLAGQLGHNLTIADTAMQSSKTDAEILGATLTGENGIITSAISALGGEDSGLIGLQTQSDALVNTTTEDVTMLGEASQAMIGETATTINETGIPAMENFDRSIEQNKTSMANLKTEVNRLGEMINNLPDSKDITITIREVHEKVSLSTGSAEFSGTVGSAFANGYQGLKADTPNALRSEYGQPELTVYPNGTYELTTTPTFSDLPKDTVIFNEEQTKRILKNSSKSGKAFADGTNYIPLRDAMPDKAAIFERFEAQLQDNVAKINANVLNMTRNMNDMTKTLTSNSSNIGNTVVLNGGINITCPGVTETEVARNLGGALNREMEKLFQGMALRADQRSLRK